MGQGTGKAGTIPSKRRVECVELSVYLSRTPVLCFAISPHLSGLVV